MNRPAVLRTNQADTAAGMIDLALGHPNPALLPLPIIRRAAEHRLRGGDPSYLQYGYEQGDGYFRRELASFLSRGYGTAVAEEQLFVSAGASQALDLICTLFAAPGDIVFVEEPTYFLALRIFADHRLQVVSIPTDEEGLIVEALEEELAKTRPAFLYIVPTHQNPSGATLAAERRLRLAELSAEQELLVVADEVYHLLTYEGAAPVPLAGFISEGNVISLGSFSKILAPGLRLGWIQAARKVLLPLMECGMLDSGGGLNPFTSSLVRSALELGLQDRHLDHLRIEYKKRLQAMSSAVRRHLAGRVYFSQPKGGFYLWLRLTGDQDTAALLTAARRNKVRFVPGSSFSATGKARSHLRLSFCYYSPEELQEGVKRLAASLDGV